MTGLRLVVRPKSCKACGFVEEGRERESALVGKSWVDDLIMGCLAHEATY
jgi:RimJ/RimL family protein N-acetyltransferase